MNNSISLHQLYSLTKDKEKRKLKIYDKILELCCIKIKNIAIQGGYNCFFSTPVMVLGLPLYDQLKCIDYIVDSWRKKGFLIQRLPEPNLNTIYISWAPSDINTNKTINNF
jgi:hypothetical protein